MAETYGSETPISISLTYIDGAASVILVTQEGQEYHRTVFETGDEFLEFVRSCLRVGYKTFGEFYLV